MWGSSSPLGRQELSAFSWGGLGSTRGRARGLPGGPLGRLSNAAASHGLFPPVDSGCCSPEGALQLPQCAAPPHRALPPWTGAWENLYVGRIWDVGSAH